MCEYNDIKWFLRVGGKNFIQARVKFTGRKIKFAEIETEDRKFKLRYCKKKQVCKAYFIIKCKEQEKQTFNIMIKLINNS